MWVEIMEISSEHCSEGVIIIIEAANNNDKAGGVCKRIAFELGGCQRIGTAAPLGRIFVCAGVRRTGRGRERGTCATPSRRGYGRCRALPMGPPRLGRRGTSGRPVKRAMTGDRERLCEVEKGRLGSMQQQQLLQRWDKRFSWRAAVRTEASYQGVSYAGPHAPKTTLTATSDEKTMGEEFLDTNSFSCSEADKILITCVVQLRRGMWSWIWFLICSQRKAFNIISVSIN